MRLETTPEQRMLEDSIRRLLADHDDPVARPAPGEFQRDLWSALAELGILGIGIAGEHGGSEGGCDEIAIVARSLGEAQVRAPFVETVVTCGGLIDRIGTDEQRETLIPALVAGKTVMALATGAIDAHPAGDGAVRITGAARLVPAGGWADMFLVAAREADGTTAIYLVGRDQPGLSLSPVATIDGRLSADLDFDLLLAAGHRLGTGDAAGILARIADRAIAAQATMISGAIDAMLDATLQHSRIREQFGRPIGAFQTVQHRVARMAVLAQEARAATALATVAERERPAFRARAIASAVLRVVAVGDHVAREAVHLHGALGMTEALGIGGHLKAVFAFAHMHDLRGRRRMLATAMRDADTARAPLAQPPDPDDDGIGRTLALSRDEDLFRAGIADFLEDALDADTKRGARLTVGVFAEPAVAQPWHATLFERGWIAPYLPAEAGGTGWSPLQAYLFESEYGRAGAPPLQLQGIRMLAPVLLRFGTDEQQRRHLPGIFSGKDIWCQGYSEPGAGSDLAALRTTAVRDGDHYVVNGSKIWTTQAQHANRMFALVRTASTGRRQDGISFLLIDMATPGITVRPIETIPGEHEVNEVFFDDVRVPVANRVGEEHHGWACAKFLLEHERGGSVVAPSLRNYLAGALECVDGDAFDDRIADIAAAIDAIEMLELLAIAQPEDGLEPGLSASARKLRMAEIRQQIGALACDALGPDALRWPLARPLHEQPASDPMTERRRAAVPIALNDLAYSIFAGSNEIQLSILARGIGMPDPR